MVPDYWGCLLKLEVIFWRLYIRTPACIFSFNQGYSPVSDSSLLPFPAQNLPFISPSFSPHHLSHPSLPYISPNQRNRTVALTFCLLALFRSKLSSLYTVPLSQFYISCSLGKEWEKKWMAEGLVLVMSLNAERWCLHCNDEHDRRTFVDCRQLQGLAIATLK